MPTGTARAEQSSTVPVGGHVAGPLGGLAQTPAGPFGRAALLARRRLILARCIGHAQRAVPFVAVGIAAALLLARHHVHALQSGVPGQVDSTARALEVAGLLAVLVGFGGVSWVMAWARRGSLRAALARWDEARGGNEAFVAALEFEGRPAKERTRGERLHLSCAGGELDRALAQLGAVLPLGAHGRPWASLVLPLALLATDLGRATLAPQAPNEQNAADIAREVAGGIDLEASALVGLDELTEEEARAVAELRTRLQGSTGQLGDLAPHSRHDVLSELEERANQAADLAGTLSADGELARMRALIAELARHADTAPLAEALRAGNFHEAARHVAELADRLASDDLEPEVERRIASAFDQIMKSLDEKQRRSLLGKHLARASEKLQLKQRQEAAATLEELARELERLAKRQRAADQLDRLADTLRSAGGRIFGGGRLKRLRTKDPTTSRLRNKYESVEEPSGKSWAHEPLRGRGASRRGPRRLGSQPDRRRPGGLGSDSPVPGEGMAGEGPEGRARAGAGNPGGKEGEGGFPIPGAAGSEEAGVGTAPMVPGEAPPAADGSVHTVDAPPLPGVPGEVVAVAHGEESATLSAAALSTDFVRAEEAALAEDPLPPSRKELALWYLRALRRSLEDE